MNPLGGAVAGASVVSIPVVFLRAGHTQPQGVGCSSVNVLQVIEIL